MGRELAFERGALEPAEIERLNAEIWADLEFDETAKAALKRDGLAVEGLRLTGPNPFLVSAGDGDSAPATVMITAGDGPQAQALLDLWRVHFLRRIRERAGRDGG